MKRNDLPGHETSACPALPYSHWADPVAGAGGPEKGRRSGGREGQTPHHASLLLPCPFQPRACVSYDRFKESGMGPGVTGIKKYSLVVYGICPLLGILFLIPNTKQTFMMSSGPHPLCSQHPLQSGV